MKIDTILGIVSILTLLFLALPVVSANINIIDVGTGYDGIDYYGYADYRNTADCNLSGTLSVTIDGNIIVEKLLDMPIRYVAGFRCSPSKTLEFPLNETGGTHSIAVCIRSQNVTSERSYGYYAEGWWLEEAIEDDVEEEIEGDWL